MDQTEYQNLWKTTLEQIRAERESEFVLWFNKLEFLEASETEIRLGASSFYIDMIRERYQDYLVSKLRSVSGKGFSINFQSSDTVPFPGTSPGKDSESSPLFVSAPTPTAYAASAPGQNIHPPSKQEKNKHPQLREDYTFDRYVIGQNNTMAANAANAAARNPGTAYNPLFIYGGVGLGKTHLMQAIGNYAYQNTEIKIVYVTAEDFLNDFTDSLKDDKMKAFKNRYRYVDILLIDDIHILQGKRGVQEELFNTFNALEGANKQMVFTCDRPATELKDISERLQSRLSRGLNVDLEPPDYETRFAILKKKVESRNIQIPKEVIDLIARNISTNVRDLESALMKLYAYVELGGTGITLEIAQRYLRDMFASPRQSNISIETIQRVVAEAFGLSQRDLTSKKRTQKIVEPRQLAMYISREITEYSLTEIGQSFGGRDHTTVMHSCDKVEERIKTDPPTDSQIQTLIRSIKNYSARI
jgi:chromosomal replication initiator protein